MKLSIIILNYNVRYFLELCLVSVLRATADLEAEVIVVDNASTDDSCKMIEDKFPQTILIKNKENLGFAIANNQGVERCIGEYICVLNPDTVIPENFFVKLLSFADSQVKVGIVGCRIIDGAGRFLPESKRNIPTTRVAIKKLFGNSRWYYANQIDEFETARVNILVGAIMLIKKSVFKKVGGFDEDYFMYAEDVDISYKVLKAGYENFYMGSQTIIHFKGESTSKDSEYLKRFYGSMQIFYKKHFRKNIMFDTLVNIGIKIIPIFKNKPFNKKVNVAKTVVITTEPDSGLQDKFFTPVTFISNIKSLENHTAYVFNINSISFINILKIMSNRNMELNSSFQFYIPNSSYIIGSNSSESKGELFLL